MLAPTSFSLIYDAILRRFSDNIAVKQGTYLHNHKSHDMIGLRDEGVFHCIRLTALTVTGDVLFILLHPDFWGGGEHLKLFFL